MRRSARPLAALAALVALAACSDTASTTGTSSNKAVSASAIAYVDTANGFEQEVFYYRSRVNFPAQRSAAMDSLNRTHSQGPKNDTLYFGPVEYTIDPFLRNAGDQHSAYFPPSEAPGASDADPTDPRVNLNGFMLGTNAGVRASAPVAYLWYPTFTGRNEVGHVDSTHALIRSLDQNNPCGYVLDLRYNYGGLIFPMVAGVSPLTGDAVVKATSGGIGGWGVDYQGATYRVFSLNGATGFTANGLSAADSSSFNPIVKATNPYTLKRPNSPVAILTDTVTASAGEFITLSFRGGSVPFRVFGTATYGVTTTPYYHDYNDGGFLNITAAVMMDRTGNMYGSSLQPDQRVVGTSFRSLLPAQAGSSPDAVVQAAVAWLNTQQSCGGTATAVARPAYTRDASGRTPVGPAIRLQKPAPVSRLWMPRHGMAAHRQR